ncbi:MAG: hypothetical protein GYB66_10535 [Chloroflexi bacterium]|nr:hypothetical protein [Chloroflexota bacterium]
MEQHTRDDYDYQERQRRERRRSRRQQITGMQVVFATILAIGLLLTINFSARIRRGQAYDDIKREVEGTIAALEAENLDLREEYDFAQSEAAVAQWAHREGKMVREGEILVIPIPGYQPTISADAPSTPTPSPPQRGPDEDEVPTWHLWWSLFFDSDPPGS